MKQSLFLILFVSYALAACSQKVKQKAIILPDARLAIQYTPNLFMTDCLKEDIMKFYQNAPFNYVNDSTICLSYDQSGIDSCILIKIRAHESFSIVSYEWQCSKIRPVEPLFTKEPYSVNAEYPGSITTFYEYLNSHFTMPSRLNGEKIYGKAVFEFVINEEGNVTQVSVKEGLDKEIDREIVKLLKHSRKWNVALKNGRVVPYVYVLPVTIYQE